VSNFDSTKISLLDIIREIKEGKVQLPDFQRGWVWDDSHVRSLLVSIARSFPIGAVMLLETGGDVRFQVRPIENVTFGGAIPKPDKLILDGQQRLTSLTQVLALDKPVKTFDEKGKPIERYYFIDIEKALGTDQLEEAFIAVGADKMRRRNFGRDVDLDLSTRELECKQMMFPCSQVLNSDSWEESLQEFAQEKFGTYMKFRKAVLNAFRSYMLPIIALGRATSKEAVCLVFEKVNTGGVPLSVFELITASFAADGYNLRDDWFGSKLRGVEGRSVRIRTEALLSTVVNTDFIQTITLLQTHKRRMEDLAAGKVPKMAAAVSAKRVAMLALSLDDYRAWADQVEAGYRLVARFLRKQCFYSPDDLPYRTQLIPLAAIMANLRERWLEPRIYAKLSRWFWCGVLGELYGGAVETRMANDLEELLRWIENDDLVPRTVYEAAFQPNRLNTLRSRNSAAYKGLSILVLREGAQDFFWKAGIQELDANEVALDIHHIFPKAWCLASKISPSVFNSIVNKTPISYKANRMIGGNAPSEYLARLQCHEQVQLDNSGMDAILRSHRIPVEAIRKNDFALFMNERGKSLLSLVEVAMGKVIVVPVDSDQTQSQDIDFEEEEA
jgi:hypothetical protein